MALRKLNFLGSFGGWMSVAATRCRWLSRLWVFTPSCIPEVERLKIATWHSTRHHQSPTRHPWALKPAPKLVSHQSPFSSGDPWYKARSFAHHFRHDENEKGSAQPTSEEELNQGITGRGKHWCYQKWNHSYGMEKMVDKDPGRSSKSSAS